MQFFRSCIYLLLLVTTPVSFLDASGHHSKHHHSKHHSKSIVQEKGADDLHLWTYDEILRLLDEVESGKVEKKCSKEDCAKINRFLVLLAKEGESSDNSNLDRDIAKLVPEKQFCDANPLALQINFGDAISSTISFMSDDFASYLTLKTFLFKSSHKGNWRKTKKFVHKHKKAILIGVAVVVAVVVVVTVVVMIGSTPTSEIKEVLDDQLEPMKALATENADDSSFNNKTRDLGAVLAHLSLQKLTSAEDNEFGHDVIDQEFKTASFYNCAEGEQAISSLDRAIKNDPANADLYLDRSVAYLSTGNYKKSFEDYTTYTIQAPESASTSIFEFSKGFAKGLPKGVRDSAEDMAYLASDLSTHPIRTSAEVYEALKQLKELASSGEWKDLSQTLAPEVYELVTHWEDLSSIERGDLSGYVFGKYGSDIIIPGAAAKIIARGAKASKILRNVRNSCEVAERTLVLESAAATKAAVLAEDLGTGLSEIKPGSFNTATKTLEHFTPEMQASYDACNRAEIFLKPYKGAMPEAKARELIHETGFPTFPRPAGIPENYIVKLSDRGAGIKYVDPIDNGTYIRIMPGKPHSPLPHQQKPYISQMRHGQALDKFGNRVSKDVPEAHIPIDEFVYKGN